MKLKGVIFGLLAFLILLIESTLLHRIMLRGIMPNLSLALVVSCSIILGSSFGRKLGLFIGFLMDVLFLNILGFYTLLFYLLGQGAGFFKNGFKNDNLFLTISIIALFDFVYAMICYLFTHFFQGHVEIGYYLVHMILPEVIYTLPFAALIYPVIRKIDMLLDRLLIKTNLESRDMTI